MCARRKQATCDEQNVQVGMVILVRSARLAAVDRSCSGYESSLDSSGRCIGTANRC